MLKNDLLSDEARISVGDYSVMKYTGLKYLYFGMNENELTEYKRKVKETEVNSQNSIDIIQTNQ